MVIQSSPNSNTLQNLALAALFLSIGKPTWPPPPQHLPAPPSPPFSLIWLSSAIEETTMAEYNENPNVPLEESENPEYDGAPTRSPCILLAQTVLWQHSTAVDRLLC